MRQPRQVDPPSRPGFGKRALGRAGNAALWAAGATWLYNAGVGYIGRANERVEPGYTARRPQLWSRAARIGLSPFEDLGQRGRQYALCDVVTPELIAQVLEEPAKATPIRVFVGYNTEPLYPSAGPSWRWRSWSGQGRSTALSAAGVADRDRLGGPDR